MASKLGDVLAKAQHDMTELARAAVIVEAVAAGMRLGTAAELGEAVVDRLTRSEV
jgi:hypothetical protein